MREFFAQLGWRPTIGDPSVMGWLTVAAYAVAAALCFFAAYRARIGAAGTPGRRERRTWTWIGLLMSVLCVNKQLDLQTLFTRVGRELAERGGWYGSRRIVQFVFVLAVVAVGVWAFVMIVRKTRLILKERKLLLFGLCFLISFIIIRASSFHHVAVILEAKLWGVRMNGLLELGGIVMIAASAARSIPRPGSSRPSRVDVNKERE